MIKISPVSAADAGNNATLSQFADEFPGLIASSTELAVPTATGTANAATTYHNGGRARRKSKYAGQIGKIPYAYWSHFGQKTPIDHDEPVVDQVLPVPSRHDGLRPGRRDAATLRPDRP